MLDLRLIKALVIGVVCLYVWERRFPVFMKFLLKHPELHQEQFEAFSGGDMALQERLVVLAVFVLYLSLPNWIRVSW